MVLHLLFHLLTFDTAGTLTSVANLTGKVDKKTGEVAGIDRAPTSRLLATSAGVLVGTSNTTSYIESGAGIKEGGKTGLTAVVVAISFGACPFLVLAQSIPLLLQHLQFSYCYIFPTQHCRH